MSREIRDSASLSAKDQVQAKADALPPQFAKKKKDKTTDAFPPPKKNKQPAFLKGGKK